MSYGTSSIPSRDSADAWPASSCSRVRVDKRSRSLPDGREHGANASCRGRLPSHHGRGNSLPPIPTNLASFAVHHCAASLQDRIRMDDRNQPAPSSTQFTGFLRVGVCHAPTEPPEGSLHCSSCSSISLCSRRRTACWMSSDRPMGINIRNSRSIVPKKAAHRTYSKQ